MAVTFNSGKVLLTADQVVQWRKDLTAAEAVVADLKRKLEAAAVFYPDDSAPLVSSTEMKTNDWIIKAVTDAKKALTPKEIRKAIADAGGEAQLGSENYLYTAIKRLADRNQIERQNNGYVLPSSSSPEREAGGPKTPGPPSGFTLSGGAGGMASEAGGT